ncbi:uncharacterized protein FMAN_06758 [Fusarium mangiferae]|uniref:Uncharacterized protein n=1 Tax=Fusarium mangiferae TaxID=192010 RepID=A0A1L7ST84_FUSMA|nr:uncharacterized protein FMAN_06758 [Fusarium mangiferae]CVK85667.1 uncharacterized protein FMAN_06758 [Fusarium mangiferae]
MGNTLSDGFVQWDVDEYDTGALVLGAVKAISRFDTKPELNTAESALMGQRKLDDTYN